jgi:signal transduction histidine kinase
MKTESRSTSKKNYFWLVQSILLVAAIALFFSSLLPFASAMIIFAILTINSGIFALITSKLEKGLQEIDLDAEQKTKKLDSFDQITRQLVKRELELARANQKLAELDKAKSDFVSVAAHQLRTPLTGIKWAFTTLLDTDTGPLTDDQKDIVEKGLSSISNTIDLVNDLLNVAHVEEGKTEFTLKRQSIIPIAQKAVADKVFIIEEKKISLTSKIPPEAGFPEVNIDGDKIGLVLANMLDNAVKYTPTGGLIDFNLSQDQGAIKIAIQDSGIGIPKSQRDRLFTKFFRADNAIGVQTDGTGLGLYMVKKIIDRHGGKIVVDSTEGKGTTFIITIPESTAKRSR